MKTLYRAYSATFTESWKQSWSTFRISISKEKTDNFKMNMNHNRHGRMILPSVTEKKDLKKRPCRQSPPPPPPPAPQISIRHLTRPQSSLSLVTPCSLLPPCDKPEDDWWRVRLGTLTMYALNVTECLVTGKKSRATFSTNQKRNENLFVCASSFDWFIRLSTYAVFYFFHTRLMYWLFTICLMVQVERQDR